MQRTLIVALLLALVVAGVAMPMAGAQEILGSTSGDLNVRTGPGSQYAIITILPVQAPVVVEGRTQIGDWLLIHTPDNAVRGWVGSRFVYLPEGVNIQGLPQVEVIIFENPAAPAAASGGVDPNTGAAASVNLTAPGSYGPVPVPESAKADIGTMEATLTNIPTFHNFGSGTIRGVFARGQELGNRRNVFTRVGDSISANQPFLVGFGEPGKYNLGAYTNLQPTIDFFMTGTPRPGYPNNFVYDSLAARSAFNAGAVLDRLWTDGALCDPQTEAPIQCEYRLAKPAIAIIMLGSVDIQVYNLESYTDFLDHIIKISVDSGVVPVLTTFTIPPDYFYYEQSLRFNMVVLDVAARYDVPVINLWREARTLPDFGVGPDKFHLSQGPTFFTFEGQERQYGTTLRNLLTLQALDELRRGLGLG
jgi:hypothetical protein